MNVESILHKIKTKVDGVITSVNLFFKYIQVLFLSIPCSIIWPYRTAEGKNLKLNAFPLNF